MLGKVLHTEKIKKKHLYTSKKSSHHVNPLNIKFDLAKCRSRST